MGYYVGCRGPDAAEDIPNLRKQRRHQVE